jgi:hypothetical protein
MMKIDLNRSERFENLGELAVNYQEELDTRLVEGKSYTPSAGEGLSRAPLEIKILGEDREELEVLAAFLRQR